MHHAFRLNGREYGVELSRTRDGYALHFEGRTVPIGDVPALIATRGDEVFVHLEGETYALTYEHPLDRLAHRGGGAAEDGLRAPMPGSLVAIHARPGQPVSRGEPLLVMESMKMETTLTAARDGVVAEIHFAPGQPFERDALLLSLEPAASAAEAGAATGGTTAATASGDAATGTRT